MLQFERLEVYRKALLRLALESSLRGTAQSIVRSAVNTMAEEGDLEGVPLFLADDPELLASTRRKISEYHAAKLPPPALALDDTGKEARSALYKQFDDDKRNALKMVRDGIPVERIYRYGFGPQMDWLVNNGLTTPNGAEVTVLGAHVVQRVLKAPVEIPDVEG